MSYAWRPKLTYSGGTLTVGLSQRPFDEGLQAFGAGIDWSAALVPSSWVTAWAYVLTVRIRFWESQRAAVLTYLKAVLTSSESHTLRLDADDGATQFTVYLVSPELGSSESIAPTRSSEVTGMLEMELKYRRTNNAAFGLNFTGV
jgi:hypothetical protein